MVNGFKVVARDKHGRLVFSWHKTKKEAEIAAKDIRKCYRWAKMIPIIISRWDSKDYKSWS